MRFLGTLLANPIEVPVVVMEYVAAQPGVEDTSVAKAYLRRDQTRLEQRWDIAQVDGWRDFADFREALKLHSDAQRGAARAVVKPRAGLSG